MYLPYSAGIFIRKSDFNGFFLYPGMAANGNWQMILSAGQKPIDERNTLYWFNAGKNLGHLR